MKDEGGRMKFGTARARGFETRSEKLAHIF
jgi:hypothetical protein